MKKVKSQQGKTGEINKIICRNLKQAVSYRIKIFRVPFNYSKFYKIEIEPVKDEKSKDYGSRPDHKS
jgi:hypothetical protein